MSDSVGIGDELPSECAPVKVGTLAAALRLDDDDLIAHANGSTSPSLKNKLIRASIHDDLTDAMSDGQITTCDDDPYAQPNTLVKLKIKGGAGAEIVIFWSFASVDEDGFPFTFPYPFGAHPGTNIDSGITLDLASVDMGSVTIILDPDPATGADDYVITVIDFTRLIPDPVGNPTTDSIRWTVTEYSADGPDPDTAAIFDTDSHSFDLSWQDLLDTNISSHGFAPHPLLIHDLGGNFIDIGGQYYLA